MECECNIGVSIRISRSDVERFGIVAGNKVIFMKEFSELLKNLVPGAGYLKATIKDGVVLLSPMRRIWKPFIYESIILIYPPGEKRSITIS